MKCKEHHKISSDPGPTAGVIMDMKRLSKGMAYVLRHTSLAANDSSGWVSVPDLQANLRMKASLEDIRNVVENNEKVGELLVYPIALLYEVPYVHPDIRQLSGK